MKNINNRELGRQGERIAREYLAGQGYILLDSNYYASHKEIDIIALDGEYIVFIEVKSRTKAVRSSRHPVHRPSKRVNSKKRANIVFAANRFMAENLKNEALVGKLPRIDVIELLIPPIDTRFSSGDTLKLSACSIKHIRAAFCSDTSLR